MSVDYRVGGLQRKIDGGARHIISDRLTRTPKRSTASVVPLRVPDHLTAGPRFAAFSERYAVHTKGRWAGRPVLWEDWQRDFWWEAFEINPATGLRIYHEIGLGLPTKNGKSLKGSVAGLYHLIADGEPEPEVYVGAAARGQAGIVLGQSRSIALRSHRLWPFVNVQAHRILCPSNGGIMRALSSDAALQHGLNPSANIIDELHAHKSPDLYTVLTKSTATRQQPFTLWISTAGGDGTGILAEQYASMFSGSGELERRDGLKIYRDRTNGVLIYWYGADRDDDPDDPKTWLRVNPASWLQDGKWLRAQHALLKQRGSMLQWRMYHLNQFVSVEEAWLPDKAWAACRGEVAMSPESPVGVGIYKTAESDACAVVVAQRIGETVGVKLHMFGPSETTGRVDGEAIRVLLRSLRATYPLAMMRDAKTNLPLRGPAYAFDRWTFGESADILDSDGLNMVDFPQYASTMGPATTQVYELITTRRIIHDGNETLGEHVTNSTVVLTDRGMKLQVRKEPKSRRNPAAVAFVMAVRMAMADAPVPHVHRPRVGVGF